MSIQDTINEAKKEFTGDEQILVSAFKLEKFYKKHKIKIFALIGALVLFFGARAVMQVIQENRLNSANEAYLTLSNDATNQVATTMLKEKNPALYELYTYKQAVDNKDIAKLKELSSSSNDIIADVSKYHLAVLENKEANSELYNEVALITNANLLIQEGKIEEAKAKLSQIGEDSPMHQVALIMEHYTIKGK